MRCNMCIFLSQSREQVLRYSWKSTFKHCDALAQRPAFIPIMSGEASSQLSLELIHEQVLPLYNRLQRRFGSKLKAMRSENR